MMRPRAAWASISPKFSCSTREPSRRKPEPSSVGLHRIRGSSTNSATAATTTLRPDERSNIDAIPGHARDWKGEIMIHAELTPAEQADRLAIRELVDAYA